MKNILEILLGKNRKQNIKCPGTVACNKHMEHRHPVLANPQEYNVIRVVYDLRRDGQDSHIDMTMQHNNDSNIEVKLRFLNPIFADVHLPEWNYCCDGFYILDTTFKQWETCRVEVGDYHDGSPIFWAESVEKIT
jgi:hypothetical protein